MASLKPKFPSRSSGAEAGHDAPATGEIRERRARRSLKAPATITALLLVVVVVVVLASSNSKSNGQQSEAIQGSATARVQRRELVETDTQTGTLGYRDSRNVYNHLTGTATWTPKAGAVIHPDGVLYRVNGAGVYLFNGAQPVYRAFKSGMSEGNDVRQLNLDLRAMGYDEGHEIALDASFSEATEAAIKRWQEAHGLKQTGEIELGRIAFQPGVRRVQSVSLSTGASASSPGGTETGGGSSGSASGASYEESSENPPAAKATSAVYAGRVRTETVAYLAVAAETPPTTTTTTPTTPATTTPTTTAPGSTTVPTTTTPPTAPKKTTPAKPSPAGSKSSGGKPAGGTSPTSAAGSSSTPSKTSAPTASGGSGTSASATASGSSSTASVSNLALVTTSLNPIVTVALETSKQTEARAGDTVQVTLPSTRVVTGHITSVASVAEKAASSSSSSTSGSTSGTSTVNVYISLAGRGADSNLDQAPVSVAFAAQREKSALSVPVTALVATAGGNYAVEVVEGKTRHLVSVTPGLFAGGYVAVNGNLAEGTTVSAGNQ